MIDPGYTRARLLAEIEAPDPPGDSLSDITDPRVATTDAHVRLCGHAREDLFPLLNIALSERFAAVPRLQLIRDLLMPLRNALGNAYKHGNGGDPAKAVSVEIVLTRKGTLIAVTDEGKGFDVARTLRRFQGQAVYFEHDGIGFRNLHRAMSTVSYENGGRTVLLCFRPTMQDPDPASPFSPAAGGEPTATLEESADRDPALPKALDSGWLQTCLSAEPLEFGNGRTRIESCRVYATGERAHDCGIRYVLRIAGHDGGVVETRILTGRLHATEAAAGADFEAAVRLYNPEISRSVRIPRPMARLAAETRLVLYDFNPWMNLSDYLSYQGSLTTLRQSSEKIARALARLHTSPVVLGRVKADPIETGLQALVARAETTFQALPSGPDVVNRFRVVLQRIQKRAGLKRRQTLTPIHGALGWHCIHYGVDGSFYLYRFETCRRSDPGLDLGGFAADLLCFTLANHDDVAYRICRDAFLSEYNSRVEHPMDTDDLGLYIVLALCERLRGAEPRTKVRTGQLLAALEAVLRDKGRAAVTEVSA